MLSKSLEINKYKSRNCRDLSANNYHEEFQYLNLLEDILNDGIKQEGRNGFTKCIFGSALHFSLENGKIPILTTKKTAWKTCLKELLWFIKGQTSNKILNDQNVHIWDGNSTPEFKKSRGLTHYNNDDLGPLYGFQWRFFNAPYENCNSNYNGKGVDQLYEVIKLLKDPVKRYSRRLVVSAWNPCQINEGVLPPCHVLFQFNVIGNKLSCSLYQRSCDCALGQPFNIASYSFLTHLIAKHCDLEPYEFIHYIGNAHIYEPHLEQMKEQINRVPINFPTINILNKRDNINDYELSDFKINNYKHLSQIKMDMVA
jgi:thymidylate synthase